MKFALDACEQRVHFALNCGAASCPPIKVFTPAAIDAELDLAARAFMQMAENLTVDEGNKTLCTTKIVSWYKSDFGGSDSEVAQTLLRWLPSGQQQRVQAMIHSGGIKVRYLPYDWSANSSMHKPYRTSDLKVEAKPCCDIM